MGMDLEGAGGYFRWTNSGWDDVLNSAESNGWQPTGTGPPRGILKADWPGNYYGTEGQRVYARDAKRLAEALKRGDGNGYYRKFIKFCRAGSFRIY